MAESNEGDDKAAKAAKIVRNHMIGSLASGIVPLPIVPAAILGGVQLRMLSKLAELYEVKFHEQRANAIIGALVGISFTATAAGLFGLIPGVGQIIFVAGALGLSAASTYALGQVFIKHFESGGTFLTFDPSKAKRDYEEKLEEGKKVALESYVGIKP
jgi:uncharacterized protein (DUF697 family)